MSHAFTLLHGYPDFVGRRVIFCGFQAGPKPYVNTGTFLTSGDVLNLPNYKMYIDAIAPALSLSGTYIIRFVPNATGPRATWTAHWYTESNGTEVTNGTDLSGESVQIMGFGGIY